MKVLVVTSNPKPQNYSVTLSASNVFLEGFKEKYPNATIEVKDVSNYEHLNSSKLRSYRDSEGEVAQVAKDFSTFDRYIFVAPMWNLSIPSGMKAYIDHLIIPGVTFKQERGNPKPIGLLVKKKALFITASGGNFKELPMSEWDHNITYMKHIFSHIGVDDYTSYYIEMAHRRGASASERVAQEKEKLLKLAKEW